MIFLGTQKLRAGLGFLFFFKVSFEKHPNGDGGQVIKFKRSRELKIGWGVENMKEKMVLNSQQDA